MKAVNRFFSLTGFFFLFLIIIPIHAVSEEEPTTILFTAGPPELEQRGVGRIVQALISDNIYGFELIRCDSKLKGQELLALANKLGATGVFCITELDRKASFISGPSSVKYDLSVRISFYKNEGGQWKTCIEAQKIETTGFEGFDMDMRSSDVNELSKQLNKLIIANFVLFKVKDGPDASKTGRKTHNYITAYLRNDLKKTIQKPMIMIPYMKEQIVVTADVSMEPGETKEVVFPLPENDNRIIDFKKAVFAGFSFNDQTNANSEKRGGRESAPRNHRNRDSQ